jgi:hypothetical protein
VGPSDERISSGTVHEGQAKVFVFGQKRIDGLDNVHAGLVISRQICNGGPLENDCHSQDASKQLELAVVADLRPHELHIVAQLEEVTSVSLEWHLTELVTILNEPRSKIAD